MKTERRQELKSNELVQQIDHVSDYVKQNANHLLIGGGIALVVVLAGYWFVSSQRAKIMDGWSTLSDSALAADPSGAILRYKEVANSAGDNSLAMAAWSRVGEVAMGQLVADDKTAASSTDWQKAAVEAYEKVLSLAGPADVAARGQAIIVLGVLAENTGDLAKAREQYKKVAEDAAFKNTPLPAQAKFRLAGLDNWSKPISFPPAAVTVPAPEPTAASPAQPTAPDGQNLIMSQTFSTKTGKAVDTPAATPATPASSTPPPVPTTQPAN